MYVASTPSIDGPAQAQRGFARRLPEHLDWTFLKYVWQFDTLVRQRIETARRLHGPDVPVIRLRNEREIGAFLSQLASSPL
jgi:hypothetical protein